MNPVPSKPTVSRALLPLCFVVLASGCYYQDQRGEHSDPSPSVPGKSDIAQSVIDTGATLGGIEPGKGVGVFVEYAQGGEWTVTTTCDTEVSDLPCTFDIIVSTDTSEQLLSFSEDQLESGDYLDWEASNAVRMVNDNSYGVDAFRVQTEPGVTLRVDVYLDGAPELRYTYWVGDGGLHRGAPTNPIDLTPSAP